MEKANFANALKLSVVKTAAKPSNVIVPGVELTPTVNKFSVNRLATPLLGIEAGDTVAILKADESEDINNKYYICKGFRTSEEDADGMSAVLGGEAGKGQDLEFNLAGIYSEILQNVVNKTTNAVPVALENLRQMGLLEGKTSLNKVYAQIESVGVTEINGEEKEVFRMFDFSVVPHTPKQFTKKA